MNQSTLRASRVSTLVIFFGNVWIRVVYRKQGFASEINPLVRRKVTGTLNPGDVVVFKKQANGVPCGPPSSFGGGGIARCPLTDPKLDEPLKVV